jgi:hypothetical protein
VSYREILIAVGASLVLGTAPIDLPREVEDSALEELATEARRIGLPTYDAATFAVGGLESACDHCRRHIDLLRRDAAALTIDGHKATPHPHVANRRRPRASAPRCPVA